MTEVEPEWNDEQVELMVALDHLICPHCGNLRADCSDPERDWYPQRSICYATAVSKYATERRAAVLGGQDADAVEVKASDGEVLWVSTHDLTPDDQFL